MDEDYLLSAGGVQQDEGNRPSKTRHRKLPCRSEDSSHLI